MKDSYIKIIFLNFSKPYLPGMEPATFDKFVAWQWAWQRKFVYLRVGHRAIEVQWLLN